MTNGTSISSLRKSPLQICVKDFEPLIIDHVEIREHSRGRARLSAVIRRRHACFRTATHREKERAKRKAIIIPSVSSAL